MNPKILFGVTSDKSLGFLRPLAEQLSNDGARVYVTASFDNPSEIGTKTPRWTEVHTPMARNPNPINDLISLIRWIMLLRQIRPQILILGTPKAALIGLLAGKLYSIPRRTLILHGLRLETTRGFTRLALRLGEIFTVSLATDVLAVSESLASAYTREGIIERGQARVLGRGSARGVDCLALSKDVKTLHDKRVSKFEDVALDPNKVTVGFVGRISTDKGVPDLISAINILNSQGIDFQTVFFGDIEDQKLTQVLGNVPNSHLFCFTEDAIEIYSCIDILCLPSLREGLPTVVLEAGCFGIPTVGTLATGIVDAIENGRTGLLVGVKSPNHLANALKSLIADSALREKLGRNARAFVYKEFSQIQVVKRYCNYFLAG
jgi:glycosyltransferase involved in cell wall biosynthesis